MTLRFWHQNKSHRQKQQKLNLLLKRHSISQSVYTKILNWVDSAPSHISTTAESVFAHCHSLYGTKHSCLLFTANFSAPVVAHMTVAANFAAICHLQYSSRWHTHTRTHIDSIRPTSLLFVWWLDVHVYLCDVATFVWRSLCAWLVKCLPSSKNHNKNSSKLCVDGVSLVHFVHYSQSQFTFRSVCAFSCMWLAKCESFIFIIVQNILFLFFFFFHFHFSVFNIADAVNFCFDWKYS